MPKGAQSSGGRRPGLSDRERAFCRHYVASGRVNESARKAGYSEGAVVKSAYLLLKRPLVIDEIERLRAANRSAVANTLAPALSGELVAMPELRRQIDAEVASQLDRVYCVAGLYQTAEIAMGRRKITKSIVRKRLDPAKGEIAVSVSEVEVYEPNGAIAVQALDRLAKLLPESLGKAAGKVDQLSPEMRAVIESFRQVAAGYKARRQAREQATDIEQDGEQITSAPAGNSGDGGSSPNGQTSPPATGSP